MAAVSPKSFLNLLQKSGLCDSDELKASVSELFEKAGGRPINLQQLTDHLVESEFISPWHVKKLTAGKYKGFFLGKYKLWQHLGTGGMSTVYLARHNLFKQMRAVKVLPRNRVEDKTFLQRFYREGRAAAALSHQNIVRVYDIGEDAETHYLVMEYVKGQDISVWVKQSGPLSYEQAIDCTIQALTGLQHAHENDLIHRDIKPANLLVSEDGAVKILDLGLVLFREEDASLTVMHDEKLLGTADYLSPEQAIDSHKIDPRSDIYSMGCTLYFMLTGKPPFPNGTIAQRIAQHQSSEPAEVKSFRPDCPDSLVDVLHKMMRKDPDERYQDCESLIQALRDVGDELLSTPSISSKKTIKTAAKPAAKKVDKKAAKSDSRKSHADSSTKNTNSGNTPT
ncbi:MAG: serine/threonine protein kinase, partial [Proteobacteria bacterium]|nr:serine/threonine protein kinase [Pseudomonadota bacterium]